MSQTCLYDVTNNDRLIIKTQVIRGTCISDHNAVFVEGISKQHSTNKNCRMVPLYKKADWDALKNSVVQSTTCDLSINDLWSSFREELTSGIK